MPPYLIGDSDIDPKFLNIQKIYDSLYLDDGKEFKYIGFIEAEKRENFFRELLLVINLLKNKLNDEYIIEDNMDFLKKTINPNEIRYSQSSVNGSSDIIQSMKANGWQTKSIL